MLIVLNLHLLQEVYRFLLHFTLEFERRAAVPMREDCLTGFLHASPLSSLSCLRDHLLSRHNLIPSDPSPPRLLGGVRHLGVQIVSVASPTPIGHRRDSPLRGVGTTPTSLRRDDYHIPPANRPRRKPVRIRARLSAFCAKDSSVQHGYHLLSVQIWEDLSSPPVPSVTAPEESAFHIEQQKAPAPSPFFT